MKGKVREELNTIPYEDGYEFVMITKLASTIIT